MKKSNIIGALATGLVVLGVAGSIGGVQPPAGNEKLQSTPATATSKTSAKIVPACDGTTVTSGCTLENITYKTYKYHPAVPEKTHTETVTTYKEEVSGYCTLCNDGTYSPSCATGRGACSHHGGVAEWNAPRYKNVPVYTNKTVIDAPAQAAYFEKVLE